jgi:8-oxo-dGTP pyrophosphatase MutT (NUDIX family)
MQSPSSSARSASKSSELLKKVCRSLLAYEPLVSTPHSSPSSSTSAATSTSIAAARRACVACILRVVPCDADDNGDDGSGAFPLPSPPEGPPEKVIRWFIERPWVHCAKDIEVFYIKRASNPNDLWSGHVAFPGGRQEKGENDMKTVCRETMEEVGWDLENKQQFSLVQSLDERVIVRHQRSGSIHGEPLILHPFVFLLLNKSPPPVVLDPEEVEMHRWISIQSLLHPEPEDRTEKRYCLPPSFLPLGRYIPRWMLGCLEFCMPGLILDAEHGMVLWGITGEITSDVMHICRLGRLFEVPVRTNHWWMSMYFKMTYYRKEFPTRSLMDELNLRWGVLACVTGAAACAIGGLWKYKL